MSLLSDNAVTLLGSRTGVITSGTNPTIYTTPVGKITHITQVVFRDPASSVAAATNMSLTGFPGTMSLTNLTSTTGYAVFSAAVANASPAAAPLGTEVAAATAVVLTTTTGAAVSVTCDVFGYTH